MEFSLSAGMSGGWKQEGKWQKRVEKYGVGRTLVEIMHWVWMDSGEQGPGGKNENDACGQSGSQVRTEEGKM